MILDSLYIPTPSKPTFSENSMLFDSVLIYRLGQVKAARAGHPGR